MLKIAAKEFRYHGTAIERLPAILSEGLNFYSKYQHWNKERTKEDIVSRESFPGTYLTNNLMTALSAAGNASKPLNRNNRVIVGVEIETRTPSIVIDEDHLGYEAFAFSKLYNVAPNGWWYGVWLQEYAYDDKEVEKVAKEWLSYLFSKIFPATPEKPYEPINRINWLVPYAVPVLTGFAEIHFADYYNRNSSWEQKKLDRELPRAEKSHGAATSRYRTALDVFLQKVNFITRRERYSGFQKNERIKEPISYNGANKIVLVATVKYEGLKSQYYETVHIHYLSNPSILTDFIKQFRERVGQSFLIIDDKGQKYYDSPQQVEASNMWTFKYADVEEDPIDRESESEEDEGFVRDRSGRVFWGSRGAGCLFVRNHPKLGPQLLTVLRSPHVEEPNTWGISGGAVRPGSDDFQTALRESREELGGLPKFRKINQYVWRAPGGDFIFTTYILEVLPPDLNWIPKNFNWEVTDAKWVSLSQAQMIGNMHFGLRDTLTDMEENIYQSPDSLAFSLNWQVKLAIRNYICGTKTAESQMGQKALGLLLGLSPVLIGGFLGWLAREKNVSPQQIAQMATENPSAIQQEVEEYKAYSPQIFEQPTTQPAAEEQTIQVPDEAPVEEPDTFGDILGMTLNYEGGYVNNPNDPGGETNHGITRNTYMRYLTNNGLPTDNVDMQNIPEDHIRGVYEQQYWNPIHGNELPQGVARQVFDYAVHSGVGRASKALQKAVGVPADGRIGPQTLQAVQNYVNRRGEDNLARYVLNERTMFLKRLGKKYPEFQRGWMNRVNQLRAYVDQP